MKHASHVDTFHAGGMLWYGIWSQGGPDPILILNTSPSGS